MRPQRVLFTASSAPEVIFLPMGPARSVAPNAVRGLTQSMVYKLNVQSALLENTRREQNNRMNPLVSSVLAVTFLLLGRRRVRHAGKVKKQLPII